MVYSTGMNTSQSIRNTYNRKTKSKPLSYPVVMLNQPGGVEPMLFNLNLNTECKKLIIHINSCL